MQMLKFDVKYAILIAFIRLIGTPTPKAVRSNRIGRTKSEKSERRSRWGRVRIFAFLLKYTEKENERGTIPGFGYRPSLEENPIQSEVRENDQYNSCFVLL